MSTCKRGHPRVPENLNSRGECKECAKDRARAYRAAHPERYVQYRKTGYERNRDQILAREAIRRADLKRQVMLGYGGRCACCGESGLAFLTIDHVAGDGGGRTRPGSEHHVGLWRRLIRDGCPDGYQCLCFNCNVAKHASGTNTCPHQSGEWVPVPVP